MVDVRTRRKIVWGASNSLKSQGEAATAAWAVKGAEAAAQNYKLGTSCAGERRERG